MAANPRFISQVRGSDGTLSACLIVKNESALLKRCLESISPAADEIIVVDTGSTDDTVAVARACGARVITSDWRDDFSYSRNISLRAAACRWILWLDADDVVPPESIPQLKRLKQESPDKVVGLIVRNQKPGNTGSEFYQARMFPNHPDLQFERRIHEQIMFSADRAGLKMEKHPVVIEHHGYADPAVMAKKARRNTELLLKEVEASPVDPVLLIEISDSYTILEEFDAALAWYGKVLAVPGCDGQHPVIASHAYMGIGNILNRREDFSGALEHFKTALALAPGRPDALYGMAVALEMLGRNDEAVNALLGVMDAREQPLQVSVDFRLSRIKAFLRVQRLLLQLNRKAEARAVTDRALVMAPQRPEIHNADGALLLQEGKLADAARSFERSLGIATQGNADAYAGLILIYKKAGRDDLAGKTIDTIRPLFSETPRFHALCRILGLPDDFKGDSADLDQERKYLGVMFGI